MMFEIWRTQIWDDENIVNYNIRNYSSVHISKINKLNEAKKHIKLYSDYLTSLQKSNKEYLIYAEKDYLYILDVKNNFKIYYDLNKIKNEKNEKNENNENNEKNDNKIKNDNKKNIKLLNIIFIVIFNIQVYIFNRLVNIIIQGHP